MTEKEFLQKTKEVLKERGWLKGALVNWIEEDSLICDGSVCLIGAMFLAAGGKLEDHYSSKDDAYYRVNSDHKDSVRQVSECIYDNEFLDAEFREIAPISTLYSFNDEPNTQEENVFTVLDCAIERIEE
jgi:hypothetical protein